MVLDAIADAWQNKRDQIVQQGSQFVETLGATARLEPSPEAIDEQGLTDALSTLQATYDRVNGGFGRAPKFPPASTIELLLSRGEQEMSLGTLRSMAQGGIYDQVGGGFARYAVDATWTIPHFEKMLYDNGLLARAYLHGFQETGDERLRRVCCETLDWALREMRGPEGAFYAALDADSEGVEGRYYVWTITQLRAALGEDAEAAIAWLGASEQGNFTDPHHPEPGLNVLQARGPHPPAEQRARVRARLLEVRAERTRP
jgi:hypothetical protein